MSFTLNSIERVEIEEAFSKMLWLDRAIVELKYVISAEQDINMKKILEMAQARLHHEMNDGWLNLCRVVKKYTEPPYSDTHYTATAVLRDIEEGNKSLQPRDLPEDTSELIEGNQYGDVF